MKGTSPASPRVRPIPIADFLDRIKSKFINVKENSYSYGTITGINRVVIFLSDNSSVKTTANITPAIIGEFKGTLGHLTELGQSEALRYFRRVCNLAVEWECLKRNPFDGQPIPKKRRRPGAEPSERGTPDIEQIRALMRYLEARADTRKGRQIYTLVAVLIYTGFRFIDVSGINIQDFDDGVIRRGRGKSIRIAPELAEILDAWFPLRKQLDTDRIIPLRYGDKFAEDGRTRIPDEAERAVIARMLRWRDEGWSFDRITDELNRTNVTTKLGAKWWACNVRVIIKREIENHPTKPKPHGEDGAGSEPDWIFPNSSGHRNISSYPDRPGSPRRLLRSAGEALGIQGLTFESLRKFHRDNTTRARPILNLWGDGREPRTARPAGPPAPSTPVESPVSIGPNGVLIAGQPKKVTRRQLSVIRALVDAGPHGLTGDELESKSGCGGYRNILATLAKDGDWRSRIRTAGGPRGRYRFAMPGDN